MRPVAVVGMAAHYGPCQDLAAFARAVRRGFMPPPSTRSADDERSRASLDAIFAVIDSACQDADLPDDAHVALVIATSADAHRDQSPDGEDRGSGTILDLGSDARPLTHTELGGDSRTSQLHERFSAAWGRSTRMLPAENGAQAAFRALAVTARLLSSDEADAVVLVALDEGPEADALQPAAKACTPSPPDAGVGALVLRRLDRANADADRVYAVIEGLAISDGGASDGTSDQGRADAIARTVRTAFDLAGRHPREIGYLETRLLNTRRADAELDALVAVYGSSEGSSGVGGTPTTEGAARDGATTDGPSCALGSIGMLLGGSETATGMASLIKTVLCLHDRALPPTSTWAGPDDPARWPDPVHGGPFYVPTNRRPWFRPAGNAARVAAISSVSRDGAVAQIILSDDGVRIHDAARLRASADGDVILPVGGHDQAGLQSGLDHLEAALRELPSDQTPLVSARRMHGADQTVADLARRLHPLVEHCPLAVALVGRTVADLLAEVERARAGIAQAFGTGSEWRTPAGSYFTPAPFGPNAEIALVYPGAFSAYPGLGREVFDAFPELWEHAESLSDDVGAAIGERHLYPRTLRAASPDDDALHEAAIHADPPTLVGAGTSFAVLMTAALRDMLGVRPAAAFGYSLGEQAMMWSLGVWRGGDILLARADTADRLRRWLGAPGEMLQRAREAGLPDLPDITGVTGTADAGANTWATHLVLASRERIADAIEEESSNQPTCGPRAFVTIVNSPRECLLAGDATVCERVIARLRCGSAPAPFNHVLHSPVAMVERAAFAELHTQTIIRQPDLRLYTAATYAQTIVTSQALAENIASVLASPVDFPRLVERVYADGARIFLEVGPAAMCTKWIRATLGERPHVAIALDQKGVGSQTAIARAVAQLVSHRVPVRLDALFGGRPRPMDRDTTPAWEELERPEYADIISHADDLLRAHRHLLESRVDGLRQIADLIDIQMAVAALPTTTAITAASVVAPPAPVPAVPAAPAPATVPMPDRPTWKPPLPCPWRSFDAEHLRLLATGNVAAVFGAAYRTHGFNPALTVGMSAPLMISRVWDVDLAGGTSGLGAIHAEIDLRSLDPDTHRRLLNGLSLPDAPLVDGCHQVLQFYLLYLGVQSIVRDARFEPVPEAAPDVKFWAPVIAEHRTLTYQTEVTALSLGPRPYVVANIDILADGTLIGRLTDLGMQMAEAPSLPPALPKPPGTTTFDRADITQFAIGDPVAVFGTSVASFAGSRVPRAPNGELMLMSRITQSYRAPGNLPVGSWLVAEQEVPPDAWYLIPDARADLPYSMAMEIALQPCGFLSGFLGSMFQAGARDLYFRNLDGRGRVLRPLDVAGQTLSTRVEIVSSVAIRGAVIQKFIFTVSASGAPLYEGDATFGYFSQDALANQIGLDNGEHLASWWASDGQSDQDALLLDLTDPEVQSALAGAPDRPFERVDGGPFSLLDRIVIVPEGGHHGTGYLWAERAIDPHDWFYGAHFFQDPVMPGSLGIEAMVQALKAYAIQQGLTAAFHSPRFVQPCAEPVAAPDRGAGLGETVWKYRGQIVPTDRQMSLELHVRSVTHEAGRSTLIADGSLWRDGLRIYEVNGLGLGIEEAAR